MYYLVLKKSTYVQQFLNKANSIAIKKFSFILFIFYLLWPNSNR